MKPFRGKRRGPQRPSVGFSPRPGRTGRRRIRKERVGRSPRPGLGCTSGAAERHDRFAGGQKSPGEVTERAIAPCYKPGRRWPVGGPRTDSACSVRRVVVVSRDRIDWQGLSSVPADRGRAASAAIPADSGSVANRSVTCPTRLETRTKESNMYASRRALRNPAGAVKAKVGPRRPTRVGSGVVWRRRTTGPSRPQRRRGGARAYTLGPERW